MGTIVKEQPAISIVVPVFNEEENVLPLYQTIRNTCDALGRMYEIVFVDDGSRDGTGQILREIHAGDPQVKVVRFRKNYGQTAAMAAGFRHARGGIIVSMDGDMQNDPADIPLLLQKLDEGFDVVCGWRKNRHDRFWTRRLPSVVANWIIGHVTGVKIHDNGCSLKAYRSSIIKRVPLYGEMHRFIPAMAAQADARVAEIIVHHHPRRRGKSKYGLGRVWRVVLDIITVKMIIGFAERSTLWFGLLSFPFILLGLSILVGGITYPGFNPAEWVVISAIALLFLFLGFHFIALGILGELIMKTGNYEPRASLVGEVHREGR